MTEIEKIIDDMTFAWSEGWYTEFREDCEHLVAVVRREDARQYHTDTALWIKDEEFKITFLTGEKRVSNWREYALPRVVEET